jgi:CheY-like chemotaxis protein
LEKVPQLEPDLVILDLAMPRMNGLQAARKLRSLPVNIPVRIYVLEKHARGEAVRKDESNSKGAKYATKERLGGQ